MMEMMKSAWNAMKVVPVFAKGILGLKKKSYRLTFVFEPEDNLWYIDMPWPGFTRDIWICPVTLCVLGRYPKYIYLKKVE